MFPQALKEEIGSHVHTVLSGLGKLWWVDELVS
jgi:hypothetical protein